MSRFFDLEPMLARASSELPPSDGRWGFEVKWDGFRALAHFDGKRVHLRSRKGNDLTPLFPELQPLAALLPAGTIVDGEIVSFASDGRPDFERLQARLGLSGRTLAKAAEEAPVRLVAFDLPHHGTTSLLASPWLERKERLASLGLEGPRIWTPPHHLGDSTALQRLTRDHRLEGVIAKRIDSRYEPGRRSGAWRKIKNWQQIELAIGGWIPAEDGGPGSLLLGERIAEGLRYVGLAELGLFGAIRRALAATLPSLTRSESPFAGRHPQARWVEPRIRVRCQYIERTASGRLRHVLLRGLVLPDSASAA